jgi:hypothetical protein
VLGLTGSRWFSVHGLGVRRWFAGTAEALRKAPWGPLPWLRGFRGSHPPQGSCWAMLCLVGAQGSQRFFSSPAQSSKPSWRHGRTRVELEFTKRSEGHAWYRGAPGVRACSLGSCGRSKRLCVGLVACTSVQGMKTGRAQISGRGRRSVARLGNATQTPVRDGRKRAILATKANCAHRFRDARRLKWNPAGGTRKPFLRMAN